MLYLLLFIVFLVLKLTAVIAWSWLWVTSPLWICALLNLIALAVLGSLAAGFFVTITRIFRN